MSWKRPKAEANITVKVKKEMETYFLSGKIYNVQRGFFSKPRYEIASIVNTGDGVFAVVTAETAVRLIQEGLATFTDKKLPRGGAP